MSCSTLFAAWTLQWTTILQLHTSPVVPYFKLELYTWKTHNKLTIKQRLLNNRCCWWRNECGSASNTRCWRKWLRRCEPYLELRQLVHTIVFLIGSAVCKAALKQGIQVTSVRYSYSTPQRCIMTGLMYSTQALLDFLSVLRKGTHPHGHPAYLFLFQTMPLPFCTYVCF